MLFYTLLAIVALFSYIEIFVGISKKGTKTVLYTLMFVFYCLSFLRWEFGSDWDGYYTHFVIYSWDNLSDHEYLYTFILVLAKSLIEDYTFVLFCFSTILFYFQLKGITTLSELPLTTLFVLTGTYFCNVGYVRQYIAVVILFYSLFYIINRKFIPFLVFVLLAFGFHYAALAFLPAYWIYKLKLSRKQLLFFILLSLILSSVMIFFLQGVGNLLGMAAITERTDKYLDQGYDYEDAGLDPRLRIIKACFNRGLVVLIGFYLIGKLKNQHSYLTGLFNLYCFGTILFFLTSPLHITLTRMSWFYDFVQILLIPAVFLYLNKKQKQLYFVILVIIMIMKLYINIHSGDEAVYYFIPSIERLLN